MLLVHALLVYLLGFLVSRLCDWMYCGFASCFVAYVAFSHLLSANHRLAMLFVSNIQAEWNIVNHS
jgi:hypothetical protein